MHSVLSLLLFAVILAAAATPNKSCNGTNCGDADTTPESRLEGQAQNKLMEDWLEDAHAETVEDDDRTWRLNRKALVPILIGLGLKALALVFLSLTALTVIGSVAVGASKLSLAISAFLFLRRFFSSDANYGGFFGLNPLKFPQRHESHQSFAHGSTPTTRRFWNMHNPSHR